MLRTTATFLLAAAAAGCGFQMSGTPAFSGDMGTTLVQTDDRHSPFYRQLLGALRAADVPITSDPTKADTVLFVEF